jgi:uncharacterized protein
MTETETKRPFTAYSFNQYLLEGKLMASRCADCGDLGLPPRAVCSECHGTNMEWMETKGVGKLDAFTVVYIAPTFMIEQGYGRDKPYVSGIVELDEGVKISARILGVDPLKPENIQVGAPLEISILNDGEKAYLAFKTIN